MGNMLRKPEVKNTIDFNTTPSNFDDHDLTMDDFMDPRSPNNEIFRTPINHLKESPVRITKNMDLSSTNFQISPNTALKKRLMEKLGCDLRDPRSPNVYINRTPLSLQNPPAPIDVAVDVTAASVEFVEINDSITADNIIPRALDAELDITVDQSCCLNNETVEEIAQLATVSLNDDNDEQAGAEENEKTEIIEAVEKTPILKSYILDTIDPRSPSIDIQRTPLLLKDSEDPLQMDEQVIEVPDSPVPEPVVVEEKDEILKKSTANIQKDVNIKELVYEDTENIKYSTPKKVLQIVADGKENKERTPLSCVGNRSHLLKFAAHNVKISGNDKNITPTLNNAIGEKLTKSKIPVFKTK